MSELSEIMNCYVLAGGRSTRMGIDKGLIILKDKAIIEYCIEALKSIFKNLIIVSNHNGYSGFGFEVIADIISDNGPAGGIYTALSHSSTEQNFIVSCDMPFVTCKAVEFIISKSINHQITVPVYCNKFEPLFAVYTKSCSEKWKQIMDTGTFKLQNIIANFKTLELNVDGNPLFSDDLFLNINSKSELERAQNKINHDN